MPLLLPERALWRKSSFYEAKRAASVLARSRLRALARRRQSFVVVESCVEQALRHPKTHGNKRPPGEADLSRPWGAAREIALRIAAAVETRLLENCADRPIDKLRMPAHFQSRPIGSIDPGRSGQPGSCLRFPSTGARFQAATEPPGRRSRSHSPHRSRLAGLGRTCPRPRRAAGRSCRG